MQAEIGRCRLSFVVRSRVDLVPVQIPAKHVDVAMTAHAHERRLRNSSVGRDCLESAASDRAAAVEIRIRLLEEFRNVAALAELLAKKVRVSKTIAVEKSPDFVEPLRRAVRDDAVHALARFDSLALADQELETPVVVELDRAVPQLAGVALAGAREPEKHEKNSSLRVVGEVERLDDVVRRRGRLIEGLMLHCLSFVGRHRQAPDDRLVERNSEIEIVAVGSEVRKGAVESRQLAENTLRLPRLAARKSLGVDVRNDRIGEREELKVRLEEKAFLEKMKLSEMVVGRRGRPCMPNFVGLWVRFSAERVP